VWERSSSAEKRRKMRGERDKDEEKHVVEN
jgi:hypothetical protein